jgi:hypothetical protein
MQHIIIEVENKILQELYLQNRQDIQPIIEERF